MSRSGNKLDNLRQDVERLSDQIPLSTSKDEALETAIKAAETCMKALSLVVTPEEKAKYTTRIQRLMREAEIIKQSANWRRAIERDSLDQDEVAPEVGKTKLLKEPVNSRALSTKEKIIALRAGFLNGVKFPEWKDPPSADEFELRDGEEQFLDESSELPLSDFQLDVLDEWKRPADAIPPPSWLLRNPTHCGPIMSPTCDIDLVQDAATDCSVVASLCAGVARGKRGHPQLLHSILYPYDTVDCRPRISQNGKYIARLNFNGCYRRVVIDDCLPTSMTDQVIHVVDRNNPGLLWPALLEKAYLKVRGGYDFPGSNSATDLWILTGWIPEQVFLQDDDLEPDLFWKRVSNGFLYGDVLITMGTGKMTDQTERALGLAGEHDYAVLDLREVDGQRLLLIKNPWVEGTSWSGRFRNAPTPAKGAQNQPTLPAQLDDDTDAVATPRDLLNVDDKLTPGTFWMDLDNVMQYFESIYLNWNTGLFAYRQDIHFDWNLAESTGGSGHKSRDVHASLQHHRQFTVTAAQAGSVWILLWRHFQNSVPETASDEDIESGRHFIDLNGHIALAVFASNGRRVMLPETNLQKGPFVDSPQILLKLEDYEPGKVYTIVPLEQGLPATIHTFTLSVLSRSPFSLSEATPPYAHSMQMLGTWTKDSAGGNAQHATYCNNPQYSIKVPNKTNISLLVEACDPQLNVHVRLLYSNGQRISRIRNKDIIVDSKQYRSGCCLAEFDGLDPGQYTVVCSTFEPQQLSEFGLRIDSTLPVQAALLPRDGAGRIRVELSAVSFKPGESKFAAPLAPRHLINFYAVARQLNQQIPSGANSRRSNNHSHVRLGVELGRGPTRRVLITSNNGEYLDSAGPVRTDAVDLSTDFRRYGYLDCWLILERMHVSARSEEESFHVELFVDQPNSIDVGDWRVWED